jgi:hypothetical protein
MKLRPTLQRMKVDLDRIATWRDWTPAYNFQVGSATISTTMAKYVFLGNTCYFLLTFKVVSTGTASGWMDITLPFTANEVASTANVIGTGREGDINANLVKVMLPSTTKARVGYYNSATFAWVTNLQFYVQGSYRV